ncbi:MAG TPA: TrkA family potassium uptake protein [Armatimonadota bacterium]|nr:TrkA family potassium uptake protein [Armatimonadota bacterium]
MYAIIAGGGRVGYYLAKTLAAEGHEVLLIEKCSTVSNEVRPVLGDIILEGDACETRTMEIAGVNRADVVAAVTGEDDDNLVICQLAKQRFGVKRTIARVNNPQNEELFARLGIDQTVSSTKIIYNLIEQEMETGLVVPLSTLRRGNLELVEVTVTPISPSANHKLADINLPEQCLIITVLRGERAIIPNGDMVIEPHDSLVAILDVRREKEFREVIAPSRRS